MDSCDQKQQIVCQHHDLFLAKDGRQKIILPRVLPPAAARRCHSKVIARRGPSETVELTRSALVSEAKARTQVAARYFGVPPTGAEATPPVAASTLMKKRKLPVC